MSAQHDELDWRDRAALAAARNAGIRVFRQGLAWRFLGRGVDIMATRPGNLKAADFKSAADVEYERLRRQADE